MATIDKKLINSAFQKPRTASSYFSCHKMIEGLDGYENYSQNYFIHIDKTNCKVACSKSSSSANFRSVDDNEANQLLLHLELENGVYQSVQNFLREKKRKQGQKKKKKKRPASQNSTRAEAATNTNRANTPSSGTRQSMLASTPPAHPQQKK